MFLMQNDPLDPTGLYWKKATEESLLDKMFRHNKDPLDPTGLYWKAHPRASIKQRNNKNEL